MSAMSAASAVSVVSLEETGAESGVEIASDHVFLDEDSSSAGDAAAGAAWELSKENVLPLRSGRRLKCLNEAVARVDSLSQDHALREERHTFETQLRACRLDVASAEKADAESAGPTVAAAAAASVAAEDDDDDDAVLLRLLDIWHRYVNWTEQNYPSGKELGEILQRSLQAFPEKTGEMGRVADQSHYVDLWLKLANQREEPGDLFQFMYSKRIGRRAGLFYEQWAWHLEDVGNTKKASAVLSKGICCEATPVSHLEKLKADLEMRVARGIKASDADAGENEENVEERPGRTTLGDLRGKGKRMTAPNVRVGPQAVIPGVRRGISGSDANAANGGSRTSSSSSRRPMSASASNTPSAAPSSGFQIFADSSDYRDTVSDNKFTANPVDAAVKSKENAQKAVAWNKARAKQKASSIPTTPLTPSFDVHVDDSVGGGGDDGETGADGVFFKTPAKTINMTHVRPLSTKKVGKEPDKPLDFLEKLDDGKAEEKFMFCKDKVYQGLEEFSFEEMRCELWKRKRRDSPAE